VEPQGEQESVTGKAREAQEVEARKEIKAERQ
jgi:hypothetical protein